MERYRFIRSAAIILVGLFCAVAESAASTPPEILVLSNRAVYLHIGAMFGTIMAANVWMVIIPNQKKIMALTKAGAPAQPALSEQAKRCSKHNTFMSVPLIFTMISNHFPAATFGRPSGPLILGALVLVGWGAAKLIRDYA